MFAELLARVPARARASAARCTSPTPTSASSAPTGSSPPGCRSPAGAALAAQLRGEGRASWWRSSATARSPGRLPRGGQPGGAVAAADGLLSARTTATRSSRRSRDQHPVPIGSAPRGYGARVRAVDGNDVEAVAAADDRRRAARPRRRRAGVRRGRHLPLARALRGRPGEVPQPNELRGVAAARPAGHAPARGCSAAASSDDARPGRGAGPGRDRGRRRRRARRRRAAPDAAPLVMRAAAASRRARLQPRRPSSGRWTRCGRARGRARRDPSVFVAGDRRRQAGGNVFALTRGLHDEVRPDRVLDTPISETAVMGLGGRRGDGGHAPGRRADVPRLPRRLPRPDDEPGGQAAVHDRRQPRRGPDRADPVRRRPLLGQPALAEPRGAARPHPRAHRGDAVDPGRHLRPAAGRDPATRTRSSSSRTACCTA